MDLETYYAILTWRGEDPTKIDIEDSCKKEFGRKIFDQDIDLGKVAWTGRQLVDFKHYVVYHNPFLAMCANLQHLDCSEVFLILSAMFNFTTFMAAITATIGYKTFTESNDLLMDPVRLRVGDWVTMAMLAAINGVILSVLSLNWRAFERYKGQKMMVFIERQHAVIAVMFTAMFLNLGYYFVSQQMAFFSWFVTIYALEVVFAMMIEFGCLRITFNRAWKRDIAMVQLDVFIHYYLTFKDYQEWKQYTLKMEADMRMEAAVQDSDVTGDEESLLEEPLLNR